jgi:hypothetical protein
MLGKFYLKFVFRKPAVAGELIRGVNSADEGFEIARCQSQFLNSLFKEELP